MILPNTDIYFYVQYIHALAVWALPNRYNDLLASAVILQNVIGMSKTIAALKTEGWSINDDVSFSVTYLTPGVKRFGEHGLDFDRDLDRSLQDPAPLPYFHRAGLAAEKRRRLGERPDRDTIRCSSHLERSRLCNRGFDTTMLLKTVDDLDDFCAQWKQELRDDILRVHATAHT